MKLNRADAIKVRELAEKYDIDINLMKKLISSPYDFIQKTSKKIEFKDDLTEEEFRKLKKNFNIPALGKLYASEHLYGEIQKKKKKS